MIADIRQKFEKLTKTRTRSTGKERTSGCTVMLEEGTHRFASYTRNMDRVELTGIRSVDDRELKELSSRVKSLIVCFSARTIYADMGDFSSVSHEATMAHIRSTVDKTGLFNEKYVLTYKKVYDLDNARARYSYLAVPDSDIAKIALLNDKEVFLDGYCPVEVSIASLVAAKTPDMVVAVYEDHQFIRIIGAKKGTIYHLFTIQKNKAFDLFAECLAGTSEMVSMMKNTYNEPPRHIFKVGPGDITTEELKENGVEAEPFTLEGLSEEGSSSLDLMGTAFCTDYDFTPKAFKETKAFARYARYSLMISAAMAAVSLVFAILGYVNSSEAGGLQIKINRAQEDYAKNMGMLQKDYTVLMKDIDLAGINELILMYQDFQSEPRLHAMLGTITQAVPHAMSLKRIEVNRKGASQDGEQEAAPPPQESVAGAVPAADPSAAVQEGTPAPGVSFTIKIEGMIDASYPQSKILFSNFIAGIQGHYPILTASFRHNGAQASCSVECEAKK